MMLDNIDNNDNIDNIDNIKHDSKDMLIEKLCIKMKEDIINCINNDNYIHIFQYLGMLNQAKQMDNSLDSEERLIFKKLIPMLGKTIIYINIIYILSFILILYI